jgi:hypothetical protein
MHEIVMERQKNLEHKFLIVYEFGLSALIVFEYLPASFPKPCNTF